MKNKLISISALLMILVGSCKKEENKIYYEDGTPPALSANRTTTIPLSFATQDNEAVVISWTNPEYRFTTGINSHDVTYTIEIDTTGANFTNPARKIITISNDLSLRFTQSVLNDYLLNQLQLTTGTAHNIQFRVTSSLGSAVPLPSNVLQFSVVPFVIPPKVVPPASGKLFITGSATPAGWMAGGDPENAAQKFTQISTTVYQLNSIALSGGNSYLFVPLYGDWNNKYGYIGGNNLNNVNGDDFKAAGGDMLAPAVSGNYKIVVDFQRGKFTVTKL